MTRVLPEINPEISTRQAYQFARHHGVDRWFDAHILHPRTRQDRVRANRPLKQTEADRFQRLQLLVERATETFGDEAKALRWLTRQRRSTGGCSPLDYAVWERNFLSVLDQLARIDHGMAA